MKTCVFAGTFDPFTTGHEYVVEKGLKLFDKVVIAVGVNNEKKPLFSLEERIKILKTIYQDNVNVEVKEFSGLLVDFMKQNGYTIYIRGVRNEEDYKYENTMHKFNLDFYKDLITVYIPTPNELEHVSSSAVKSIVNMNADFAMYLPKKSVGVVKEILKLKK